MLNVTGEGYGSRADEAFERHNDSDDGDNDILCASEITASEKTNDSISIDVAIDRLGCGRFQWIILIAAGMCFAADAMEVTLLSFLSAVLKHEWDLTGTEAAGITSSVFMGQLLGTIVLGRLGDAIGRRPVFLVSAAIISFFGVATAFATNYISVLIMRTVVGFGVGGIVVPFDILAELLPGEQRGKYLLYVEYFWTFGAMSVPIFAYLSIGIGGSWNLFVLLCAIPCLLSVFVGVCYVPESPRWLLSAGRTEEALVILRRAAVTNGLDPEVVFPPDLTLSEEEHEVEKGFSDLFTRKWRLLTLLIWGTWIGFAYGYYGTILIVTRVFENDGEGTNGEDGPTFDYVSILITCSAEFVGTTIVILLVDRVGRVAPQVGSYLLGGMFVMILSRTAGLSSRSLSTVIAFCARTFEMCATCLTWVSTAEIYTTEIRTTGHSSANAMARMSAFFCPYLVEGNVPLEIVGIVLLVVHVFTAACASCMPETKGHELGKSEPFQSSLGYNSVTEKRPEVEGSAELV